MGEGADLPPGSPAEHIINAKPGGPVQSETLRCQHHKHRPASAAPLACRALGSSPLRFAALLWEKASRTSRSDHAGPWGLLSLPSGSCCKFRNSWLPLPLSPPQRGWRLTFHEAFFPRLAYVEARVPEPGRLLQVMYPFI